MERTEREEKLTSASVQIRSVDFYSQALQRKAHYLIALPLAYASAGQIGFPVLFLLHGIDGTSQDWVSKGDLARYLESHHLIAVMPDGSDSYYANAALRFKDRYEDFIARDLVSDVDQNYRTAARRETRGIAGISVGGYGAVKIALRHPDEYTFAAGLSSALDATRRPFALRRLGQSFRLLRIFGTSQSATRRENDVFDLIRNAKSTPYFFIACGTSETLLSVNRSFANLLDQRGLPHEYHEDIGGHSWDHWSRELPGLLDAAESHLQPVK